MYTILAYLNFYRTGAHRFVKYVRIQIEICTRSECGDNESSCLALEQKKHFHSLNRKK